MQPADFVYSAEHEVCGHTVFVGMDANEQFYAIHNAEPHFCLLAGSERGALKSAGRALASWLEKGE